MGAGNTCRDGSGVGEHSTRSRGYLRYMERFGRGWVHTGRCFTESACRDQGSTLNRDNGPFLNNRVDGTVAIWRGHAPLKGTVIGKAGELIFQKLKTRVAM